MGTEEPFVERRAHEPCKHYGSIKKQVDKLENLPGEVSRMTGIVYVIGGLFTLLVGLAFNAHFETLHQAANHNKRFDALSGQIAQMSEDHLESKYKLSERLIRIEAEVKNQTKEK